MCGKTNSYTNKKMNTQQQLPEAKQFCLSYRKERHGGQSDRAKVRHLFLFSPKHSPRERPSQAVQQD